MTWVGLTRRSLTASVPMAPVLLRAKPSAATLIAYPKLRRGIGIYHVLGHLTRTGDGIVRWPPYSTELEAMSDSEIDALKEAGFDFARVTVVPDVFFQAKDSAKLTFLERMMSSTVSRFLLAGLNVVLDMHPSPAARSHAPQKIAEPEGNVLFAQYKDVVVRMARILRAFPPSRVALEVFNEPPFAGELGSKLWQALVIDLFHSARAQAPNLCLIIPGAGGGTIDGFLALDPRPMMGDNVYFTFHFYEPYLFTHQGVGDLRDIHDAPWPSDRSSLKTVAAAVYETIVQNRNYTAAERISALAVAQARLTQYFVVGATAKDIQARFSQVFDWAAKFNVPLTKLVLGEFGVNRAICSRPGARSFDTMRWVSTVREIAERHEIAWAFWSYAGPTDMTLANEYPAKTFSATIIRALGLSVPPSMRHNYR